MLLTGVPEEVLQRAARMYKTNKEAGAALGMSMRGFARACRRHGIETPYARRQKSRRPKDAVV
jgi:hypothetical protein